MTIFYVLKASTKQEKAIIIDEKVNNKINVQNVKDSDQALAHTV